MFRYGLSMLQKVRAISSTFFYHFGIHCATHQIRLILISSVVITSLFYPALAIYSSPSPHIKQSFSDSTSRILDSFLAARAVSGFYAQHDLRNIWEGHQELRVVEDAVSRAKCLKQRTLRVERVLIQSPFVDDSDSGALNHQILQSTLDIERNITKGLRSARQPCLERIDGECFVLSPLAFWHHASSSLSADANILDTLNLLEENNISVSGIPVTPHMVLAGRGSYDYENGDKFDYATFLALTYFFPDLDCLGNEEHTSWLEIVKNAVRGVAEPDVKTQEFTLIALEYNTFLTRPSHFSAISLFLYFAYLAFFIYVGRSMRQMVAVHSRIGLTFTALVEIAVSTITSLSVCALVGFKVTMVPWELLPIVIVFVGAENMFSLVDAVTRTSVTKPVKQRIALGLSHAGTSNTLKVVSYNSILGTLSVFAGTGAIRQFCVFAIVVLVAHWFLAHTFFLAVLSIDIQRLDLDQLLRQNTSTAPTPGENGVGIGGETEGKNLDFESRWSKFLGAKRSFFRRRITKDISLVLLLAIAATLYYTTYATPARSEAETTTPTHRGGALARSKPNPHGDQPPAWHIWKTLNPEEDPMLHLRIEMPTIVTLSYDSKPSFDKQREAERKQKSNRLRFAMRTLKPIMWLIKIVVLPITATTSALYFLCLYLLKDAELLEAQRNRAEYDSPDAEEDTSLEGQISFTTMPRAFTTDVELVAASGDGRTIASVSMQSELAICWRKNNGKQSHVTIDITDLLLRTASTSSAASAITALSINEEGNLCAVGTGAGVIAVWALEDERTRAITHLTLEHSSSGIRELQFVSKAKPGSLLAVYENGTAAKWTIDNTTSAMHIVPSHQSQVLKCMVLQVQSDSRVLVAFVFQEGAMELVDVSDSSHVSMTNCLIRAGNPADVVSKVSICKAELGGTEQLIVGAATEAGVVSLWDGTTGDCIYVLDDVYGDISHLRISSVPSGTCHYCGELPLENFTISFSIGNVVLFYRAYMADQTRRCACARNLPRQTAARETNFGRRSRTSSISSLNSIPPSNIRLRLSAAAAPNNQSALDTSSFPVSGHGVHSRRASEKDSLRRLDNLTLPLVTDEHDSAHPVGPLDVSPSSPVPRTPSAWQNLHVVRLAETSFERGSWDVSQNKIVGLRRKARSNGKAKVGATSRISLGSSQGLTAAALDRWEIWTFDPSLSRLQSSPLTSLIEIESSTSRSRPPTPEKKDTIPRLPFTRVSSFSSGGAFSLAGFGNTIGVFKFCL